jgi:RNA polymerase sigma-70 factor (ECF subfamily)
MSHDAMGAAMERYADGDDAAFNELYDLLSPRIYAFLLRQTRSKHRAEDLVQQTFLQIHRSRSHFKPGADVLPWAFAIARRLTIDSFRRSHGGAEEAELETVGSWASPLPLPDDLASARQLSARVGEELSRLPENQRVAFEMIRQEGLSVAEAAQVLGTTITAVKLRAHRAYLTLRASLGEAFGREESL